MIEDKCIAVVLAGGKGTRMKSNIPKQYIELDNIPLLYYSLKQFQESDKISEIILVTGEGEQAYCRENLIERYKIDKISNIVAGGKERFNSVYNALESIQYADYVFVHDGARPFLKNKTINKLYEEVKIHKACVVGVRSKDTVKISDNSGFISKTPDRDNVWIIQTPQVFEFSILKKAYELLMVKEQVNVTDDAMVVEAMLDIKVKLVEGEYTNIKVTTPSDLLIANAFIGSGEVFN